MTVEAKILVALLAFVCIIVLVCVFAYVAALLCVRNDYNPFITEEEDGNEEEDR